MGGAFGYESVDRSHRPGRHVARRGTYLGFVAEFPVEARSRGGPYTSRASAPLFRR